MDSYSRTADRLFLEMKGTVWLKYNLDNMVAITLPKHKEELGPIEAPTYVPVALVDAYHAGGVVRMELKELYDVAHNIRRTPFGYVNKDTHPFLQLIDALGEVLAWSDPIVCKDSTEVSVLVRRALAGDLELFWGLTQYTSSFSDTLRSVVQVCSASDSERFVSVVVLPLLHIEPHMRHVIRPSVLEFLLEILSTHTFPDIETVILKVLADLGLTLDKFLFEDRQFFAGYCRMISKEELELIDRYNSACKDEHRRVNIAVDTTPFHFDCKAPQQSVKDAITVIERYRVILPMYTVTFIRLTREQLQTLFSAQPYCWAETFTSNPKLAIDLLACLNTLFSPKELIILMVQTWVTYMQDSSRRIEFLSDLFYIENSVWRDNGVEIMQMLGTALLVPHLKWYDFYHIATSQFEQVAIDATRTHIKQRCIVRALTAMHVKTAERKHYDFNLFKLVCRYAFGGSFKKRARKQMCVCMDMSIDCTTVCVCTNPEHVCICGRVICKLVSTA